jgi:hypothetical protein
MNGDTPFDRLVADALAEPMMPETAQELDDRVAELAARHVRARSPDRHPAMPHSRTRRAVLLVAALFIVVGCVVVRDAYSDNENATQFASEMADARAVTPIPPGATWPPDPVFQDPEYPGDNTHMAFSYPLGHEMVEMAAACLWEGYWLDGHDRGDAAQTATALAGLEKTRTWQTFTDPRLTDQGIRTLHKQVVDGAEKGDPTALKTEFHAMGCVGAPAPGSPWPSESPGTAGQ